MPIYKKRRRYSVVPKVFAENGGHDLIVIALRLEKRMFRC